MFTVLNSNLSPGPPTFSPMPVSLRLCTSGEYLINLIAPAFPPFSIRRREGKRPGRQRAKSFDDARGSAIECAACLDASVAKRIASEDRIRPGKQMLARIVAMLTRLVDRFDANEYRIREDPSVL
jgi:hypothetical protein